MSLTIESVPIDDVLALDHVRYNTNNHWKNDIPPDDYQHKCQMTNSDNWIHLFKEYHEIHLDLGRPHLSWLKG